MNHAAHESQLDEVGEVGLEHRIMVYDGAEGHHYREDHGSVYHAVHYANWETDVEGGGTVDRSV